MHPPLSKYPGSKKVEPSGPPRIVGPAIERVRGMLVERGIQVMNFEVVGDAYAIASNYLRKTGAIPHTMVTDERLLRIIIRMFQHGEYNRLKLANKAIAEFEARLEHDPEKCEAVFRKDHAQTKI